MARHRANDYTKKFELRLTSLPSVRRCVSTECADEGGYLGYSTPVRINSLVCKMTGKEQVENDDVPGRQIVEIW